LIAQIFENPVYFSHLPSITAVTIHYTEEAPPTGLWYLAAWLQQCLERAGSKPRVRVEHSGVASIEFESDGLKVSVKKVEGSAAEVKVNALVNRTVFPEASDYVLLREELSIAGHDPIYEAALPLAAALAGKTRSHIPISTPQPQPQPVTSRCYWPRSQAQPSPSPEAARPN
jgi:Glucose-6-phosphate dehydrogenase subunit.